MENTQFLKAVYMKALFFVLLVTGLMLTSGCSYYGGIKGTVVDNATGKPIEGAVVVAQWTKKGGLPGMAYSNLHKITETLTDKEGKFSLSGTIGMILDPPEMIIYKEGYVPWRNDMIYPGGESRYVKEHEWNDHRTYHLDKFTGGGKDIIDLSDFTSHGFMIEGLGKTPKFDDHIRKLSMASYEEVQKQKNP